MTADFTTTPAWTRDALCAQVDPEIFHPRKGGSTKAAKAVCASCPVLTRCLEYALTSGPVEGIWGGTSERERHAMRQEAA